MNEFYFNRSFWVSVAWSFLEIDWIMLSTCLNDPNQNFESNDESSKAEIFFFSEIEKFHHCFHEMLLTYFGGFVCPVQK